MAWHFDPKEPRDFHGRWVEGVGEIKKLVKHLADNDQITSAQARVAIKTAERKEGDADALEGLHLMHEHLAHLSTHLRMKAAEANKNKTPTVARQRRVEARAVEAVHAAITGATPSPKPSTGPKSAPNAPSEWKSGQHPTGRRYWQLPGTDYRIETTGSVTKGQKSGALEGKKIGGGYQALRGTQSLGSFASLAEAKDRIARDNNTPAPSKPPSGSKLTGAEFNHHVQRIIKDGYARHLMERRAQGKTISDDQYDIDPQTAQAILDAAKAHEQAGPAKPVKVKKQRAAKPVELKPREKASTVLAAMHKTMTPYGGKWAGWSGGVNSAENLFKEAMGRPVDPTNPEDVVRAVTLYTTKFNKPHNVDRLAKLPDEIAAALREKLSSKRKLAEIKREAESGTQTVAKAGGVVVKAKTKLQAVKVIGSKLKEGDIITFGRNEPQIRILTITDGESGRTIAWERVTQGTKKGVALKQAFNSSLYQLVNDARDNETGVNNVPTTKEVFTVRRPVKVQSVKGKAELTGQVSAQEFYTALQDALASGSDLSELDPSKRPLGRGQTAGHVQQLLYDMAVGKKNGIGESQRVVTKEEYLKRLEQSGELEKIRTEVVASLPYRFRPPYLYGPHAATAPQWKELDPFTRSELVLPGDTSHDTLLQVAHALGNHGAAREWAQQWFTSHPPEEEPPFLEYARSLGPLTGTDLAAAEDYLKRTNTQRWRLRDREIEDQVTKRISELRKEEGTAPFDFRLPRLDEAQMQSQTWDDIHQQMEAAPGQYIPVFYNASMLEDGVVYHRLIAATSVDAARKQALQDGAGGLMTESEQTKAFDEILALLKQTPQLSDDTILKNVEQYYPYGLTGGVRDQWLGAIQAARQAKAVAVGTDSITTGRGSQEGDKALQEALTKAGAYPTANSKNIDPGYKGSGQIYAGQMLLLQEGGAEDPAAFDKAKSALIQDLNRLPSKFWFELGGGGGPDITSGLDHNELNARIHAATSEEELHTIVDQLDAEIPKTLFFTKSSKKNQRLLKKWGEHTHILVRGRASATTGGKRIEYVPWAQPTQGAPRNQRGRLTFEGYTPEEAEARMRELGIVGVMEPEVPFEAVMGGPRRAGVVTPIHSAYVRGEAQPPDTGVLPTHGLTSRASEILTTFKRILDSGGLLSIAERYRRGIHASTSSPAGDIRSGIDHVVFCALNSGGTCGSGSPIKIGLRPHALLRRDVVLAPRDFGGMGSRYNHYKRYRDALEAEAGQEVGRSDLYDPLAPEARELHLRRLRDRPGSSEYNVSGQVSIEDMQVIAVNDNNSKETIEGWLTELLKNGRVKEIPIVVVGQAAFTGAVKQ